MDKAVLNTVERRVIKVMYLVNIDRDALKKFNISHEMLQDLAERGFVAYNVDGMVGSMFPQWELTEAGNFYAERFLDLSS